jgi:hypothetical protein
MGAMAVNQLSRKRLIWEAIMQTSVFIAVCMALVTSSYATSDRLQFWNLTPNTVTEFYLSPTGTDQWGRDQCPNDKDVEPRLADAQAGHGTGV